ncbi:MAG: flagellar hook-associated protein FlgK [Planctomycetes bacterium RBG_13_63_9]|nr:MAG: flagellar hook-associated protein FlgK [Planctomycetes bacterium RBG_13_63_9]
MSLFGSIQIAANSLRASEIALQVIGQNIANANTPGYIREEVVLSPAPTQRRGHLLLGLGVEVEAVVQKIDLYLEERLRASVSDRMDAETQESSYMRLETLIGELTDTDLSTMLTSFFSSIAEVLNDHQSVSARQLVVLQGNQLAVEMNRLADRARDIRSDMNDQVINMADSINRLTEEIRLLNVRIANAEGGNISASDAVGLRDQRLVALENLAKLVRTDVREQPSGGVAVYCGGDWLVFEGTSREVEAVLESAPGFSAAEIQLVDTRDSLDVTSGELRGLLDSRDEIMTGFLDRLDEFARTFAFEFNKLYSQGQGLTGYQELTAENSVDADDLALSEVGLPFTPASGSFELMVYNTQTDITQTTDVLIDLNGIGHDTTLADLATMLDAVDGISSEVTISGKLTITSDSADQQFAFRGDTSGVLAALGLNTFFSGSTAADLGINSVVEQDPATFAASSGGIGADAKNAEVLAGFIDMDLKSHGGASLAVLYDRLTGETTQSSSIARAVADGARVFEETLRGQKLATSGVSLDEEAVRMIAFQRAYQASARYITVLSELFEITVNL